jgi:hypothetical protein
MAWRVRRHRLDRRAPREALVDVIGDICGLHAQVMSSAELAAWARVEELEADALQQALWKERSLLKTWAMRGTLHLLPAAEFPLWQAALSTYRHYLQPAWLRVFGITREELERMLAAIAEALDGRMLTRGELADEVARLTGIARFHEKLRESWGALLKPAAFRGYLCFTPSAGPNVRFTRPDWSLHGRPPVDPDQALREVTRRYLGAYGPVTWKDYARWWGGLTPAQARKRIEALGEEITDVDVEGTRGFMLAPHPAEAAEAPPPRSARLLPAFDPWVIGASRDVPALLPGPFRDRIYRPQGWMSPVLLVNGRMDGVWRHERKGSRVAVRIEPFVKVPAWVRRAAEEEAQRLAAFLGGRLDLGWD